MLIWGWPVLLLIVFDLRWISSTCQVIVCVNLRVASSFADYVWFEVNQFFLSSDCSCLIWGWQVLLFLRLFLFDFRVPSCSTCRGWWMGSTRELRYTTCVASFPSWSSGLWSGGALTPTSWLTGNMTQDADASGHPIVHGVVFKWLTDGRSERGWRSLLGEFFCWCLCSSFCFCWSLLYIFVLRVSL